MNSMDRRSQLREVEFLILFRADFFDADGINEQIDDFFEDEDGFRGAEKERVRAKVLACCEKLPEIDAELDSLSVGWKTKRMTKVDLTVLRLALYEIKYDDAVPDAAAINEAVELAKSYGTESSASFVNGILAKAVKTEEV